MRPPAIQQQPGQCKMPISRQGPLNSKRIPSQTYRGHNNEEIISSEPMKNMKLGPKPSKNPKNDNDQQTPCRDINLRVLTIASKSSSHRCVPTIARKTTKETCCNEAPISKFSAVLVFFAGVVSFGKVGGGPLQNDKDAIPLGLRWSISSAGIMTLASL